MNKAELKNLYGGYCDTDKLVDDMMALLSKYRHRNSEHGVCKLLDEYFRNKASLIELLSKSSHYAGDMRIILDMELERENKSYDISDFCSRFGAKVGASKHLLVSTDAHGKKVTDYLKTGVSKINIKDLDNEEIMGKLTKARENLDQFTDEGYTKESDANYGRFMNSICNNGMRYVYGSTLNEGQAASLNGRADYKLAPGMKTSRAFNRICTYYKINECPQYNKLFAQYADMVSGLKRKLKFFISVNPLDYLTMSFGNSWASCHTIDKNNIRRMPNDYSGMYCGGTLSYMLDKTSIITYVHTSIPDDVEEGKLYRNMFHYDYPILVQSRVYPQGNDGNTDLYKIFRGIVQNEFAELLGLQENMWTKSGRNVSSYTNSSGVHYRDYTSFGSANVSYPKECKEDVGDALINIGHNGICPYCGEEYSTSGYLSHGRCTIVEPAEVENTATIEFNEGA